MLKKDKDRRIAEATVDFLSRRIEPLKGSATGDDLSVYEGLILLQNRVHMLAQNLGSMAKRKYQALEGLEESMSTIKALGDYSDRLNQPIHAALKLVADAKRESDPSLAQIHGEATDMTILAFEALPQFLTEIETGVSNLVPDHMGELQKGELYRPIAAKKQILHDIEKIQEAYYRTIDQVGVSKNSSSPPAPPAAER